jgi:hypothetical protein
VLSLDYDPKNPTDLMGRPIAVGDIVVRGGSSAVIMVAEIVRIRFLWQPPGTYKNAECAQHLAESYQLYLRCIKTAGAMPSVQHRATGETYYSLKDALSLNPSDTKDDYEYRTIRLLLVKNVVKLEPL